MIIFGKIKSFESCITRNFWLFNPKSEELLISLLCPKVRMVLSSAISL